MPSANACCSSSAIGDCPASWNRIATASPLAASKCCEPSRSGGFGYGKLWAVDDITALRITTETFPADDPNYNPDDSGMKSIHCRIERTDSQ